jgi:hypothetical protein
MISYSESSIYPIEIGLEHASFVVLVHFCGLTRVRDGALSRNGSGLGQKWTLEK